MQFELPATFLRRDSPQRNSAAAWLNKGAKALSSCPGGLVLPALDAVIAKQQHFLFWVSHGTPSSIPAAQDGSFTPRNTDVGQGLKPSGSRRNAHPCRVAVAEERMGAWARVQLWLSRAGTGGLDSCGGTAGDPRPYSAGAGAEASCCCAVKSPGWQCTCERSGRRPAMWCATKR